MTAETKRSLSVDAVAAGGNVLIRASAGTGKTYQLARRYIELLRTVPPERMLATTFTRKAAGEILERILLELAKEEQKLACEAAEEEQYPRLREFTRKLHRVHIGTLDSFFVTVGSAISLELGLPAGWRIVDEHQLAQLRLQAIETLLQEEETTDVVRLMHLLSKGEARHGVTMQLHEAVQEFHTLFLTTPPEAWSRLGPPPCLSTAELNDALEAHTRLVMPDHDTWEKSHATAIERASRNDWEAFIESGVARALVDGKDTFARKPIPDEIAAAYNKLIAHAAAVMIRQLTERNDATWRLLSRYDAAWNRLARDARCQSFLNVTLRLAAHFAKSQSASGSDIAADELDRVAFRMDSQIEHLLLDEFQDTSISQWNALSSLSRQVAVCESGSLFCVGDVKQAIYSWRGGRSELFTHLPEEVHGLSVQSLNESRRSAQPVIDVVNEVFQNAPRHPNLKDVVAEAVVEFSHDFPVHTTAEKFSGYVELTAVKAEGDDLPGEAVARAVTRKILELRERASGCSVGILLRTNEAVGKMVYALRQEGIDASEEGGTPITDSAAVQLMLSALTLADHPGDSAALFHVVNSPLRSVLRLAGAIDVATTCAAAAGIRQRLVENGYARTLQHWGDVLREWCGLRDRDRMRQIVELADEYQPLATLRSADFIRFVEQRKVESPSSSLVRVMTIHQANGLQFDVAILGELETLLLSRQTPPYVAREPSAFASADGMCLYVNADVQSLLPAEYRQMFRETARRGVREALCLLYVGMTRAARALYMFCPPNEPGSDDALSSDYAGLLSAAMVGRRLNLSEIFTRGDADWCESLPAKLRAKRSYSEARSAEPIRFAQGTDAEARARSRRSPSQKTQRGTLRLSRALQTGKRKTMDRAALIHAWFESIAWLDDGRPSTDALRAIAEELGAAASDISACLSRFQSMLTRPEIAFTLSRGAYASPVLLDIAPEVCAELAEGPLRLEVERERRFIIRDGSAIVSGAIDRLVLIHRGDRLLAADILDYKTDDPTLPVEEAVRRRAQYHVQLQGYARAVASIYQIPENSISTRLVMLGAGRVQSVDWRLSPERDGNHGD